MQGSWGRGRWRGGQDGGPCKTAPCMRPPPPARARRPSFSPPLRYADAAAHPDDLGGGAGAWARPGKPLQHVLPQLSAPGRQTWVASGPPPLQEGGAGSHTDIASCLSTLQVLAYVPPVGNCVLRDARGLHDTMHCPLAADGRCATCLLSQQLRQMLTGACLRPTLIVGNLRVFSKTLQRGRQEDVHDFFTSLLDAAERDSRKGLLASGHGKVSSRMRGRVQCIACSFHVPPCAAAPRRPVPS